MSDHDSPPPSWYEPPAEWPTEWPVTCRACDRRHEWMGEPIPCECGHTILTREAERDYPAKEEREPCRD